jgi:cob(I)alamin adenosyltransferase
LKQEQDYGEQAGTQGLATSAAVNQAQSGQFDPLVAAYATGDENKVQEAIDAQLKDPVIQTRLSELEKQLKEATFDADVYAANLANQMSEEQIQMLKQQARLLGFEGDVKSVLSNVIRGIQGGNLDLGDVASLLLITGLNKL